MELIWLVRQKRQGLAPRVTVGVGVGAGMLLALDETMVSGLNNSVPSESGQLSLY